MTGLPVSKIWGAGNKSQEVFKKYNIKTCAGLHELPIEKLQSLFGTKFGIFLYKAVRGEAAADFDRENASHSMSVERTFQFDIYDAFEIQSTIMYLSQTLIFRMIKHALQCKTVAIKIRYGDFHTESAQVTLLKNVSSINELYDTLLMLFNKKYNSRADGSKGVRLLGAALQNLHDKTEAVAQEELFDDTKPIDKKNKILEEQIVKINNKFPDAALSKGLALVRKRPVHNTP
jgi:DNA polymerase-4